MCGSAGAAAPAFTPTNEITSNDIYGLAGRGDTLWMATNWGINFTVAKSETLSWTGFKSDQGRFNGAIGFGGGRLMAALVSEQSEKNSNVVVNDLWMYSHGGGGSGSYTVLKTGFADAEHIDSLEKSANFSAVDMVWTRDHFWLACLDGGLLRYDAADGSLKAFLPGKSAGLRPQEFTRSIEGGIANYPDTSRHSRQRVIAVDAADPSSPAPTVWAATPAKLWKFSPQEQTWDSLPATLADGTMTFLSYYNVYVSGAGDSAAVYAAIKFRKETPAIDTIGFFAYDASARGWKVVVENLENPPPVAFGQAGEIYLGFGNQVRLYEKAGGAFTMVWSGDIFQRRMTLATGGDYPDYVNDILCLARQNGKAALWIGSATASLPTNNGLFFSLDEKKGERDTAAFYFVHRDKKLGGGLKQSYAYPGILNAANSGRAVFAYNLSKASKVTIRIFDWNMDPVKTVIRERERPAGNDRSNGRSTNIAEDFWDGTTDTGRRVAVGVYYYKINAQSGEHSFGKIIVAR
jgi:hypothetical protein